MKLTVQARYPLPEKSGLCYPYKGFGPPFPVIAFDDGRLVALGLYDEGERYCLIGLEQGALRCAVLHDLPGYFQRYHRPTLIKIDERRFGVVDGFETVHVYTDLETPPVAVGIENGGLCADPQAIPRQTSLRAVGENGRWLLICADAQSSADPRTMVELTHDGAGRFRWNTAFALAIGDFPHDNAGSQKPPVVGCSMIREGRDFLFVEGSDWWNVLKQGTDFYSLVTLEDSPGEKGRIAATVFEAAGFRKKKTKHALMGAFSSSKRFLILTPVFAADDWKGAQKLLDLTTITVLDVPLPRGCKKYQILDHTLDRLYLSDGVTDIVQCAVAFP